MNVYFFLQDLKNQFVHVPLALCVFQCHHFTFLGTNCTLYWPRKQLITVIKLYLFGRECTNTPYIPWAMLAMLPVVFVRYFYV